MKKTFKVLGILALTGLAVIFLDISCIFRSIIGIPCLGCGTTRAWVSLLQGHVVDAFYWHPLFWLTVPLLLITMIKPGGIFKNAKLNRAFWMLLTLMYVAVYLVRFVMLFPDTPPMDFNYNSVLYHLIEWLRNLSV